MLQSLPNFDKIQVILRVWVFLFAKRHLSHKLINLLCLNYQIWIFFTPSCHNVFPKWSSGKIYAKHKNPYLYIVSLPSSVGVVFPHENGVLDLHKRNFFFESIQSNFFNEYIYAEGKIPIDAIVRFIRQIKTVSKRCVADNAHRWTTPPREEYIMWPNRIVQLS